VPNIDFVAVDTPRFTRPELLRHGTIPHAMYGVAPRNIKGGAWWDVTRRAAYEANNMRCWACGGPGPLEAHEAYQIDYYKYRMIFIETVALCSYCHTFIHIGRLIGMFAHGEVSSTATKRVVLHGYQVLKAAGLKCPWQTRVVGSDRLPWKGSTGWIRKVLTNCDPIEYLVEGTRWCLVFEGKEYYQYAL
jgi:hypothetical protein